MTLVQHYNSYFCFHAATELCNAQINKFVPSKICLKFLSTTLLSILAINCTNVQVTPSATQYVSNIGSVALLFFRL
jgi:hypothetical protein